MYIKKVIIGPRVSWCFKANRRDEFYSQLILSRYQPGYWVLEPTSSGGEIRVGGTYREFRTLRQVREFIREKFPDLIPV